MLELDPLKRAKIKEICNDDWLTDKGDFAFETSYEEKILDFEADY